MPTSLVSVPLAFVSPVAAIATWFLLAVALAWAVARFVPATAP